MTADGIPEKIPFVGVGCIVVRDGKLLLVRNQRGFWSTDVVGLRQVRTSQGKMQHQDTYRPAYIRGLEGIIVALAEQLGYGVPGV